MWQKKYLVSLLQVKRVIMSWRPASKSDFSSSTINHHPMDLLENIQLAYPPNKRHLKKLQKFNRASLQYCIGWRSSRKFGSISTDWRWNRIFFVACISLAVLLGLEIKFTQTSWDWMMRIIPQSLRKVKTWSSIMKSRNRLFFKKASAFKKISQIQIKSCNISSSTLQQ